MTAFGRLRTTSDTLGLDQNYLNWYIRHLIFFGMWNPFEKSDGRSLLYTYYGASLFCTIGMAPSIGEIIHTWRSRRDIVPFTQHFTLATATVSTMAKILNTWRHRSTIEIACDLLNWERRQPCNRKFAMFRDEVVTSTIRLCKLFSFTFYVMVVWYCSFSYGKDVVYNKGNMDNLSISPLLPYRSNESWAYWLMFTIDKTTISYLAGCTACYDTFFMGFLMHVSGQLDLLKGRLESCRVESVGKAWDSADKTEGQFELSVESVCRSIEQEITLDPNVELHTCIRHHQRILRYVNLVQSIFNSTLLIQFCTSLLIITMTGFQYFGTRGLSRNEMINTTNLLTCAIFQLFLYCWFGTEIIVKSESIGMSAYNLKWYIADASFKKTLSILLCRGQIPIVLRAGAICELSSTTFMNVISKCYSSMALLKQVNE